MSTSEIFLELLVVCQISYLKMIRICVLIYTDYLNYSWNRSQNNFKEAIKEQLEATNKNTTGNINIFETLQINYIKFRTAVSR